MERTKAPEQKVTVMLPVALVAEMRQVAEAHRRSLTRELIVAMEDYLERQKQTSARDDSER